jgi:hypothetical protein
MDYRDCFPRFPLLPGQPDRLLAELYEAQTALVTAEYYVSCWCAYPSTAETPSSRYQSGEAHKALHEALDIIDQVVKALRIQVAGTSLTADQETADE